MQARHLARFVCAAAAALFLSHNAAVAAAQSDEDVARNMPAAAADAERAPANVKVAQGGVTPSMPGASPRAGSSSSPRARSRSSGRRTYGQSYRGRGHRSSPGVVPRAVFPFVFGFDGPYYDDDFGGQCVYWNRRCAANWGYRTNNYYGCMRYYGC